MADLGYRKGDLGAKNHGPPPDFGPGDRVVYARRQLEQIGDIDRVGYPIKGATGIANARGVVIARHSIIDDWVYVRWDTDPATERASAAPGWNGKDAIDFDDKPSEPHAPDDVIQFTPRRVAKAALAYDPKYKPGLRLRACE